MKQAVAITCAWWFSTGLAAAFAGALAADGRAAATVFVVVAFWQLAQAINETLKIREWLDENQLLLDDLKEYIEKREGLRR